MRHVHLIAFLFIVLPGIVSAQTSDRFVIAPDGGSARTNNMVLDWTLGEPVSGTGFTNDHMFTQGFQQPVVKVVQPEVAELISSRSIIPLEVTVVPNPVNTTLTLNISDPVQSDIDMFISDGTGKTIIAKTIAANSATFSVDVSHLTPGLYILRLYGADKTIREVFKISKIQ